MEELFNETSFVENEPSPRNTHTALTVTVTTLTTGMGEVAVYGLCYDLDQTLLPWAWLYVCLAYVALASY